uniref:Uncharacterized protein n=1 Tax=Aegilops tauschii subsp. strangulata TaxID=200361 RepID=A0A452YN63_AEGTS
IISGKTSITPAWLPAAETATRPSARIRAGGARGNSLRLALRPREWRRPPAWLPAAEMTTRRVFPLLANETAAGSGDRRSGCSRGVS